MDKPGNVYVYDTRYSSMYSAVTLTPEYESGCIGNVGKMEAESKENGSCKLLSISNDVNLCIFKDKALMFLLDNCLDPNVFVEVELTQRGRKTMKRPPVVVKAYRKYLRLVDNGNAHRAAFGIEQRTLRKHNNTFMSVMKSAIFCNAALIWADIYNQTIISHKELMVQWINNIAQKAWSMNPDRHKLKPRKVSMDSLKRSLICSAEEHRLIEYSKDRRKQIECKYCRWVLGIRRLTTWKCSAHKIRDIPFGFCKRRHCFQLWIIHRQQQDSIYD